MEPDMFPLFVQDGFKKTRRSFPEAPGAVVACFDRLIYNQHPLMLQESFVLHTHEQAQAGATGTQKNIIVLIQ